MLTIRVIPLLLFLQVALSCKDKATVKNNLNLADSGSCIASLLSLKSDSVLRITDTLHIDYSVNYADKRVEMNYRFHRYGYTEIHRYLVQERKLESISVTTKREEKVDSSSLIHIYHRTYRINGLKETIYKCILDDGESYLFYSNKYGVLLRLYRHGRMGIIYNCGDDLPSLQLLLKDKPFLFGLGEPPPPPPPPVEW